MLGKLLTLFHDFFQDRGQHYFRKACNVTLGQSATLFQDSIQHQFRTACNTFLGKHAALLQDRVQYYFRTAGEIFQEPCNTIQGKLASLFYDLFRAEGKIISGQCATPNNGCNVPKVEKSTKKIFQYETITFKNLEEIIQAQLFLFLVILQPVLTDH